ncbi:HAD family phosphatase [Bacillaceae bacterium SIJ1]|uniref:Cof-type HAD-IIB family hydrolase n=1 Tax=Litoribacterium kuwaitense TaxID=1398745 RepID=UPI0013ED5E31|nr:Cof-type HAD-IIB family hydrolase [Litoribacterium kuwaitense]NGP44466.1 HAD family phosphatase [Litoribacterium kuwaitense]
MKDKKFSGILLVSDMDGTLLDSDKRISRENKKTIDYFVEHGGTFTLATGRMPESAMHYLNDVTINAPGIFYNGGTIFDLHTNKVLYQETLSNHAVELTKNYMSIYPTCGTEIYHDGVLYIARHHRLIDEHLRVERFTSEKVNSLVDVPQPWQKVIFVDEHERIDQMELEAPEETPIGHYVRSDAMFLELLPPAVSKGKALTKLAASLQIPIERVCAVGDNMNDKVMLETAGAGFAVSNACGPILQCAPYQCCSNDEHALVEVIAWIEANWTK